MSEIFKGERNQKSWEPERARRTDAPEWSGNHSAPLLYEALWRDPAGSVTRLQEDLKAHITHHVILDSDFCPNFRFLGVVINLDWESSEAKVIYFPPVFSKQLEAELKEAMEMAAGAVMCQF